LSTYIFNKILLIYIEVSSTDKILSKLPKLVRNKSFNHFITIGMIYYDDTMHMHIQTAKIGFSYRADVVKF